MRRGSSGMFREQTSATFTDQQQYAPIVDNPELVPSTFRLFDEVTNVSEQEIADEKSVLMQTVNNKPRSSGVFVLTEKEQPQQPNRRVSVGLSPALIECEAAAINNYRYMIGGKMEDAIQEGKTIENEATGVGFSNRDSVAFFREESLAQAGTPTEAGDVIERLKKSFGLPQSNPSEGQFLGHPTVDSKGGARDDTERASRHEALPIPYTESCISRNDLTFDSLDFSDVLMALKSPSLITNVIFAIRVVLFCVFPSYMLVSHPKTAGFFAAQQLIPAFGAALCLPHMGLQCQMTVMMLQTTVVVYLTGIILQMTNVPHHAVAWWLILLFSSFFICLLGDVPSKRIIMVFVIMMMAFELKVKPDVDSTFPFKFSRDFFFTAMFAQFSAFFPYPTFTFRLANERMKALHALHAAALGNAIKSFWAPVFLDAEVALNQMPYAKMRGLSTQMQVLMKFVAYEPIEFGWKNIHRKERIDVLTKIRWCLYSLSAASRLHLDARILSKELVLSEDMHNSMRKIQDLAFKLLAETMRVIVALGDAICPEEVRKIDFGPMAELSTAMEDLIKNEREATVLSKKFTGTEINYILRSFSFHTSMINIVNELLSIESWAVNFDPSKYPSFWTRAKNFCFADYWRDFWIELPKRLTLATPRDVRLVKDGIRYACGFTAAIGFTLGTSTHDTYYFGMAILARIAQQTASETLSIGMMRICGVAFGGSFAHLVARITSDLVYIVILLLVFGFICVATSQHPVYGHVGQYAIISAVAGMALAQQSTEMLMNRITDNVFAFSLYLIVCLVVFPVDPIRVVSNMRTKTIQSANELTQQLVVLGCSPITKSGEEAKHLIASASKTLTEMRTSLIQALDWNVKSATEPSLRGDPFPERACADLFRLLAEMSAVQQVLLGSMKSLHRHRTHDISSVVLELFELIRPFLLDVAKIIQRSFQLMIDASEVPFEWSLEQTISNLWLGQLAVSNLKRVTGHLQHNFIVALLPEKGVEAVNKYISSTVMENNQNAMLPPLNEKEVEETIWKLMNSFRKAASVTPLDREDLCVFESVVIHFSLVVRNLAKCLPSIIEIQEFERSRRM